MAWHEANIPPIPCNVHSASPESGGTQQHLLYLWTRQCAYAMHVIP
jgi:hypothetical protein